MFICTTYKYEGMKAFSARQQLPIWHIPIHHYHRNIKFDNTEKNIDSCSTKHVLSSDPVLKGTQCFEIIDDNYINLVDQGGLMGVPMFDYDKVDDEEPAYDDDNYVLIIHTNHKYDDIYNGWPGRGPMISDKLDLEAEFFTGSDWRGNNHGFSMNTGKRYPEQI